MGVSGNATTSTSSQESTAGVDPCFFDPIACAVDADADADATTCMEYCTTALLLLGYLVARQHTSF
jgi:hypothetical protein